MGRWARKVLAFILLVGSGLAMIALGLGHVWVLAEPYILTLAVILIVAGIVQWFFIGPNEFYAGNRKAQEGGLQEHCRDGGRQRTDDTDEVRFAGLNRDREFFGGYDRRR